MVEAGQIVVVGGGISGLACAFRLQQLGLPVTLLEASERVGGLMGTVERDGFLFESGPQSFQGTGTLLALIRDLGIESDLLKADARAPRYVLRHGRLQKVPMSPQAILGSSLLSMGSRWKVASEPFRKTTPPSEEETIASFVRRKFGHEILEYLVSPFVSGVYAGDPERLSLRAAFPSLDEWERQYGSVLRGAMKSRSGRAPGEGPPALCSFRHGMSTLTQAMAARLSANAKTGSGAESIASDNIGTGKFRVRVSRNGTSEMIPAQAIVLAAPAYVASHLIEPMAQDLARKLSGIAYASLAVVASAYRDQQAGQPLNGFGVLIPRSEKHRTLGIVWNTSLFPDRAPIGHFVVTSFVGGATDLEIARRSEAEISSVVAEDLEKILRITGPAVASSVWIHHKALPQYNLGHGHVVEAIRDAERSLPGLYFAGNYLEGPSIGKCVEDGFRTAEAVQKYRQSSVATRP